MTEERALIQIVPTFPPEIGGVGDYAEQVGGEASAHFGLRSIFVSSSTSAAHTAAAMPVVRVGRSADDLSSMARRMPRGPGGALWLVLHYSGYGFDGNGAPLWLSRGIESCLDEDPGARLAVVFHELYATSPPWRRAFWHSVDQLRVAKDLARNASHALCATEALRAELLEWNPALDVRVLPMPSNVGEPAHLQAWECRPPRLLVFGLAASRARLYARPRELRRICDVLGVEAIDDVGAPAGRLPDLGRPIEVHGVLPAARVSSLACSRKFAALYNSAGSPAKSGVFACYCAHGTVPILVGGTCQTEGLAPGLNYLTTSMIEDSRAVSLGSIAASALSWYRGHRLRDHAAWLDSLLDARASGTAPQRAAC